jgi:DNA polymerase (family 10)
LFSGRRRIAEEIYKKVGLAFIPPELREDRGEIALAAANKLPRPVMQADIRGDPHLHSDWTDGTASIEAMAEAARARGYAYICAHRPQSSRGHDPWS